ncbi:MAG: DNA polymerase III subunit beta [Clostridia bacterium]|jgi:DNA polymerase-3 subunit beta|nr:DNA polymerase III subunit beta [Clostridia bacterium]
MKIICQKEDLLHGVNIVSKAVSNRTTLPILECILIDVKNDTINLIGNDLELAINSKLVGNIEKEGSIAIESKMFSEIVRKLPDNEVTIEVLENNLVKITSENCEFKLMGQDATDFPKIPEVEKEKMCEISEIILKNMIKQTIFSVAIEETKPILTGELFEIEGNSLKVVSCDGYRVSYREEFIKNNSNEPIKIVVPGKTLSEINKILEDNDENVKIYYTDNHILFDLGSTIVVSRLLEGEYFNYSQSFTKDYETKVSINKSKLLLAIERAALMSRVNKKHHIKINISEGKINISSNTEIGEAHEDIYTDVKGKDILIGFNPKYLIDALKAIDDDEISIQFTSSLSPCIIEGQNYKYLVMAVRLS